ncbi:hypothetical protein PIB30_063944 [Stylosanthes scabra]|uniref:Uncharacterized protein n=1 Tax=Stylosanthes scabra TaxID=79078 RepID=A0ABU6SME6_9FABA|nr:hypothetical protein [Stylosanthes scabra]
MCGGLVTWRNLGRRSERIRRSLNELKKENEDGETRRLRAARVGTFDVGWSHGNPGIVDNPDIPSYQPPVHGGYYPSALSPLQMSAIAVEVDCHLDIAFVTMSSVWRVHCVCQRGGAKTEADQHGRTEEDEQDCAKKIVLTRTSHLRRHAALA